MKKFLLLLSVFMVGSLSSLGIVYAVANVATPFPDVDYGDYYGESLLRMQEKNVIAGYSDGRFGPNDPVTRAQIVAILDRYDQSLFNANYGGRSVGIMYLLCDGLEQDAVKPAYQSFYDDICNQVVLL